MEKIDLVIQMQERQHASMVRVHDKIDDLTGIVGSKSVEVEGRLTRVETLTSLRNRALMAVVALLPAIVIAAYYIFDKVK